MGITIGPTSTAFPEPVLPMLVEIRDPDWEGDWKFLPELDVLGLSVGAERHGLDEAEIRYTYGQAAYPWEGSFSTRVPVDLGDWWVRISVAGPGGYQPQFAGKIAGLGNHVWGSSSVATGREVFQAYGGAWVLGRIDVAQQVRADGAAPSETVTLDWVAAANRLPGTDDRTTKSAGKWTETYAFGDQDEWTHRDLVEHWLEQYVRDPNGTGPTWTLGGELSALEAATDPVALPEVATVQALLQAIISPETGYDYHVRYKPPDAAGDGEGFEVFVFALHAVPYAFATAAAPFNLNVVRLVVGQTADNLQTRLPYTLDERIGRIRVRGERMVVCCSWAGASVEDLQSEIKSTLEEAWTAALESEYKAGDQSAATTKTAAEHDAARADDRYRPVYQHFKVIDAWSLQEGQAAPNVLDDGTWMEEDVVDGDGNVQRSKVADYQKAIRETLGWLPLYEGMDYSTDPATDNRPAGTKSELRKLAVFLPSWDDKPSPIPTGEENLYQWQPADKLGISVSAADRQWGVELGSSPNHRLAKNHWSGAADTDHPPEFDWDRMVATVAIRSDRRLTCEWRRPDWRPEHGTLEVIVSDAEFWFLAPHTAVGTDRYNPDRLLTSGDEGRVLRNDAPLLHRVLAGLLARHRDPRVRAEVQKAGFAPWAELVGQVLVAVHTGGLVQPTDAPITNVVWTAGDLPTTTIRTGHYGT